MKFIDHINKIFYINCETLFVFDLGVGKCRESQLIYCYAHTTLNNM